MPSNKQRIIGVAATAVIVFGGGWLASLAKAETVPVTMAAAKSSGMTVTVKDVRNAKGHVYVTAFSNKAAYDKGDFEKVVGYAKVKAKTGTVTARLPKLTSGSYAIVVFHDENGNEDMDMKGGYPSEGYGNSGSKGKYDETSFAGAQVKAGPVSVQMHYLQ